VFYGLTVFHGLHVLVGACALAALVLRSARGQLTGVSLRLWTLYLHMVAVLWAIMFVAVYLL
jgi:heme/copper-type cytochrome/quinol oxidase subunit 3